MSKLTYDDKIKMYEEYKKGFGYRKLANKYNVSNVVAEYIVYLIDRHGYDVLRTTKNRKYTIEEKQEAINRVLLNNEAIWAVSLDIGLPSFGTLNSWITKYKEMGYNIVERKRERSPTMPKKDFKPKTKETIEEEIERLRKENLYLKAELEYSKKLRAVVQARKNQQQKKK